MASINTVLAPNNISISTEVKDKLYSTIKKALLLNKNNSSDLTTLYNDFNEEFRKFCIDANNPLLKEIAEDLKEYTWSENDPYGIALAKRLFRLLSKVSDSQDLNKGLSSFSGLIKDRKNLYSFSHCLFERSIQQKDAKTALATLNVYADQLIDRRITLHLPSAVFEDLINLLKIAGKSIGSTDLAPLFQKALQYLPSLEKAKNSEKEILTSLKIVVKNLAYKKSNDLILLAFEALSRLPTTSWDEDLKRPITNILSNIKGVENSKIKAIQNQYNQKFLEKKSLPKVHERSESKEEKKVSKTNELELFSYADLATKKNEFDKFMKILTEFYKNVNDHSKDEFCNIVSILNYAQATKTEQNFNQKRTKEFKAIIHQLIEKLFILEKGNAVIVLALAADNILNSESNGFYQNFKNQISIYSCSFNLFSNEVEFNKKFRIPITKIQAGKLLNYIAEMSFKLNVFSQVYPKLATETIFKLLDVLFSFEYEFDEATSMRTITFLFKLAKCEIMQDKSNSYTFYKKIFDNIDFIYRSKNYSMYRKMLTPGVLSMCLDSFVKDETILKQNPDLLDQLALAKIKGFTIVCADSKKDEKYHAVYFTNLLGFLKLFPNSYPINEFYIKFKDEMSQGVGIQYDSQLGTSLATATTPYEFFDRLTNYFYKNILNTTDVTSYELKIVNTLKSVKEK